MQQDLRKLPGFHEMPSNQWPELFRAKLDQCNVIFDFTDITCDVKSKDIKRLALYELRDHVASTKHVLANSILEQVVDMFGRNVFRTVQPRTYRQPELFDIDDEPTLEVAWPHIGAVYELFLAVMESQHFNIKKAKAYVDQRFVLQLLQLFDCEDPRERDLLKTTLHGIYDKFLSLRYFIRQSINRMLLQFIYESERFNGVAEFLEILDTIIYDLVIPLKEEYKTLLTRVLLPLHKPTILNKYHPQLVSCVLHFLEKDTSVTEEVVRGLLRYWPKVDSAKEVIFLHEVEDILEVIDRAEFVKVQEPLFRQFAKSVTSPHSQVAEKALSFWNTEQFRNLVRPNVEVILPIMFDPLYENFSCHWNRAVQRQMYYVMEFLVDTNPRLFDSCMNHYSAEQENVAAREALRKLRWAGLQGKANQRISATTAQSHLLESSNEEQ